MASAARRNGLQTDALANRPRPRSLETLSPLPVLDTALDRLQAGPLDPSIRYPIGAPSHRAERFQSLIERESQFGGVHHPSVDHPRDPPLAEVFHTWLSLPETADFFSLAAASGLAGPVRSVTLTTRTPSAQSLVFPRDPDPPLERSVLPSAAGAGLAVLDPLPARLHAPLHISVSRSRGPAAGMSMSDALMDLHAPRSTLSMDSSSQIDSRRLAGDRDGADVDSDRGDSFRHSAEAEDPSPQAHARVMRLIAKTSARDHARRLLESSHNSSGGAGTGRGPMSPLSPPTSPPPKSPSRLNKPRALTVSAGESLDSLDSSMRPSVFASGIAGAGAAAGTSSSSRSGVAAGKQYCSFAC